MDIYIVMICDRHTEPQAKAFFKFEDALEWAKSYLKDYPINDVDLDEDDSTMSEEQLARANWLFYKRYSCEGDAVWIYKDNVN